MKIGIFISSRNPHEGGGYTISYDILNNLIDKLSNKSNFLFILVNDNNNFIKNKLITKNLKFLELNEYKFIRNTKNIIFTIFPFILKIYRFFKLDKFYNLEIRENINLVWFISAEYSYPLFKNYIATVWDLMHITHSNFPEVGNFFVKFYRSLVVKNFLINAKKIITGTRFLTKILKKTYFIKANKIVIAPHPTPSIFLKYKHYKFTNNLGNFFLYPANFWQHKNHNNLIKAFNLFNLNKNMAYKLVLVGSVKDRNYYKSIINLKNISESKNNILILNFVSLKKIINLYDCCLALVYASHCGPENLPPLEAFARNKPVLCSQYVGAKEQLKNYPFYFDSNDILSIKNCLNNFVKVKNFQKLNYKKFAQSKNVIKYIKTVLSNISK